MKSKVVVSLKGWKHLTGVTGFKKRSFNDIYRRLKLLPYADEIIKTSTTIKNIVIKNKRKYYAIEAVIKVKEGEIEMFKKIRVIIQEDKNKIYRFYSVMDKKMK